MNGVSEKQHLRVVVKKYYRSDEEKAIFPIPTLNQIKNYKQQLMC